MELDPLEPRSVPLANGWRWIVEAAILFRRQPMTWNLMFLLLFLLEIFSSRQIVLFLFMFLVHGILVAGPLVAARDLLRGQPVRISQLFSAFTPSRRLLHMLLLALTTFLCLLLIGFVTGTLTDSTLGAARVAKFQQQLAQWSKVQDPAHVDMSQVDMEPALFGLVVICTLSVPLLMAVLFAPARIVLDGRAVVMSLRESFRACLRNVGPFLVYSLCLCGLFLMALVPVMAVITIAMNSGGPERAYGMASLVVLLEIMMFRPVLSLSVFMAYCDLFPSTVTALAPLVQGLRRPPP